MMQFNTLSMQLEDFLKDGDFCPVVGVKTAIHKLW